MAEKEKKNVEGGSSLVLVEQTPGGRRAPFHSEESRPELLHKRSKAPHAPSLVEEKNVADESDNLCDVPSQKGSNIDKQKPLMNKISSIAKKRSPSPETITLAPMEVERKKGSPLPIPADIGPIPSAKESPDRLQGSDNDSDVVAELRVTGPKDDSPEWGSGDDNSTLAPFHRMKLPTERPSGIAICIPKKSQRSLYISDHLNRRHSGITLTVSKKKLGSSESSTVQSRKDEIDRENEPENDDKIDTDYSKLSSTVKERIENIRSRIKSIFKM